MNGPDAVLEAALAYARRGWAVFPAHGIIDGRCTCRGNSTCKPGKHPRTRDGLHSATTDAGRIRAWGTRWRSSNLAIRTGEPSGLVVLDIDGPTGEGSLTQLELSNDPLPVTACVMTGGAGRHLYFAHPGQPVKSSVGRLSPGIDVRADGACVIAPPSRHASRRQYSWCTGRAPWRIDLAEIPDWLLALLSTEKSPAEGRQVQLEIFSQGTRNQELLSLAGSMRRRGMSAEEIEAALLAVNEYRCRPPLGTEEVHSIARSAGRYPPAAQKRATGQWEGRAPTEPSGRDAAPILVRLSEVEPASVRWLWPGRIPIGKLTLLAGDPGLGKSLVTLDMAARITRGAPWPDGQDESEPSSVILLSAEDDAADTIRPRLDAAGADVERIVHLVAVEEAGEERSFNVARHLDQLDTAINQTPGTSLIVIDPVSSYLGGVDSHANAEVRGVLEPLARLAGTRGVAVLAVTHLRKSSGKAVYRMMGSLAFAAAARAVWCVIKDLANEQRRLLLPVKANLAPDTGGLAYSVQHPDGSPVIAWEPSPIPGDAEKHMGTSSGRGQEALDEAVDFLRCLLAHGPTPVCAVQREARELGISAAALRRARARLGIKPHKNGYQGTWLLALPKGAHEE